MAITGRLSLNVTGLFTAAGGRRLPMPLPPRPAKLRGAGRPQGPLTLRPAACEGRKSPCVAYFPLPL